MSGNYLLDTSVLIELFAQDTNVLARLEKAESTFIPSIALGELHYGARKSSRTEKNYEKQDNPYRKMIFGLRQWRCNMGLRLQLVTIIFRPSIL